MMAWIVSPAEVSASIVEELLGQVFSAPETKVVCSPGVEVVISQVSELSRAMSDTSKGCFPLLHFTLELHTAALQEGVAKIPALNLICSPFGSEFANCLLCLFLLHPQLIVLIPKLVKAVT